jgi:hypothetical protein
MAAVEGMETELLGGLKVQESVVAALPVSVNDWKKLGAPVRTASTQNVRAVVSLIWLTALTLLVPAGIVNAALLLLVHPACTAK